MPAPSGIGIRLSAIADHGAATVVVKLPLLPAVASASPVAQVASSAVTPDSRER